MRCRLAQFESLSEKVCNIGTSQLSDRSAATVAFEERFANRLWVLCMEYKVPDSAGDAVTFFYAARAVVIQVIALKTPEKAIAKLSEMQEIMEPLFADIAFYDTR